MHLAFDMSWTHVETRGACPAPGSAGSYPDVGMFEEVARIAERGLFDMIFFGDSTGIPNTWEDSIEDAVRWGVAWPRLDMSPWITAMSRVTSHVGFGLTYASTFMHPFYVARLLNSLDHITNGRIAFNVITSQRRADAANYGFDELMEHGARYDRMEEFIDVCKALWASVEPDAFVWDRETGRRRRPGQGAGDQSVGRFFKVKGPLSVRAVAARPSGTDPGRRLAARHPRLGAFRRPRVRRRQAHRVDGRSSASDSMPALRRARAAIRRRSASSGPSS